MWMVSGQPRKRPFFGGRPCSGVCLRAPLARAKLHPEGSGFPPAPGAGSASEGHGINSQGSSWALGGGPKQPGQPICPFLFRWTNKDLKPPKPAVRLSIALHQPDQPGHRARHRQQWVIITFCLFNASWLILTIPGKG